MLITGLILLSAWRIVSPPQELLVISEAQIEERIRVWEIKSRLRASAQERQSIVGRLVEDQVLVQEALSRGYAQIPPVQQRLHDLATQLASSRHGDINSILETLTPQALESDTTIHAHLIRAVENSFNNNLKTLPPSVDDIEGHYQQHLQEFTLAPQRSLYHVFISGEGEIDKNRLGRVRNQLNNPETSVAEAYLLGDNFLNGYRFERITSERLKNIFGEDFANVAFSLPIKAWSAAIPSAYGWHFVWVDKAESARVQPLAEVKEEVVESIRRQRYQEVRLEAIRKLARGYQLVLPVPYEQPKQLMVEEV